MYHYFKPRVLLRWTQTWKATVRKESPGGISADYQKTISATPSYQPKQADTIAVKQQKILERRLARSGSNEKMGPTITRRKIREIDNGRAAGRNIHLSAEKATDVFWLRNRRSGAFPRNCQRRCF